MATVVASSYTVTTAQRDGRSYVTETFTLDDGTVRESLYLAEVGTDYDAHLANMAEAQKYVIETRCAVCQLSDGLVVNIIVSEVSAQAQDGCELVEVMAMQVCNIGHIWNGKEFYDPNPPPDEGAV